MASDKNQARFRQLVADSRAFRDDVRAKVGRKEWRLAEPDLDRLEHFSARFTRRSVGQRSEALQGDTADFQPAWFLSDGAKARRAVAYVEVTAGARSSRGSGFLISPSLFITNQHVVSDIAAAKSAQIVFDREMDENDRPSPTTSFLLDPDRLLLISDEKVLDYAIVAVGERISGDGNLADFGFCPLSNRADKHAIGMAVNIIQHPLGLPKFVAVRNNMLQYRTDRTLLYETDTDQGSSGAPVFNDRWEVVALHHWGEPFLERMDERGKRIPVNVNEGVRISAIYADLEQKISLLSEPAQELLRQALLYDKQTIANEKSRTLGPPRRARESSIPPTLQTSESSIMSESNQELRVILPIEVIVRLANPDVGHAKSEIGDLVPATKVLKRAAEKLQIDADYANRSGYRADFIPGLDIPLPEPNLKLANQIATLRGNMPDASEGELKYEHFSIKMNKAKRVAMFTATNIDGPTYLRVARETGLVSAGAEGETWFTDPRISESFVIGQDFYSAWSLYFDRGHLTRRTDPTWGTADEAERANSDTYHFTNCAPQHFRFNQSAKFWQGIEQYVLENGVLESDDRKKLSVFQGPIYNDSIDRWADDIQIPSSFFKILVWKGQAGVKSVCMIADQLALLDEERVNLGPPRKLSSVNIQHWRTSVGIIEKRTGLTFPKVVHDSDTFGQDGQPQVGETIVPIQALSDIPLF